MKISYPSYVFLQIKDHPMGRAMLDRLTMIGAKPLAIIEEQSSFGKKRSAFYEECLNKNHKIPSTKEIVTKHNIEIFEVDNHNSNESIFHIKKHQPDLIILGNTRIIKKQTYELAKQGCINTHPGILPDIKGSYPVIWSIIHDKPIGCTCHFIDEMIDTGPIIKKQIIDIHKGYTIEKILEKLVYTSALLITDIFTSNNVTKSKSKIQPFSKLPAFTTPDTDTINKAKQKLYDCSYKYITL